MKIAILSSMEGNIWGGSEELWYRTSMEGLRQGHQILLNVSNISVNSEQILKLKKTSIKITNRKFNFHESLFLKILKRNKFLYKFYTTKIAFKAIIKFKPDLILLSLGHTFEEPSNLHYIFLIQALNVPYYLLSQHNLESAMPYPLIPMHKHYLLGAKKFYFVSQRNHICAQIQTAMDIPNFKKIDNPVNIKNIDIKKYRWESECLTMACVARLDCSYKGQHLLIHSLSTKLWKSRKYKLSFFGEGPDAGYLQSLINYYGVNNQIKLVGHVQDIDKIWQDNMILVLPSISEGTPLVLIEAMLSGRPALGTDVGDIGEYIKDHETGFLIKAPSIGLISEALEKVWEHRHDLIEMGKNAYNHAKNITDPCPEKTLLEDIIETSKA